MAQCAGLVLLLASSIIALAILATLAIDRAVLPPLPCHHYAPEPIEPPRGWPVRPLVVV